MTNTILRQIQALQKMAVGDLQAEWLRLYGEPSRSRNKQFLFRRLAWRVQELAHGGLSEDAKTRIDELAPDGFTRARVPQVPIPDDLPREESKVRDLRLPTRGTVLTRQYRGREIRVVTLDDGFEWRGQVYGSLSAVARAVTGQKWNGRLFFGLTKRKR